MPRRVAGRPAGAPEQARLTQEGRLPGRGAGAPVPDHNSWGRPPAPDARAWSTGQRQANFPGQAEGQRQADPPGQPDGQRQADPPRQPEEWVALETGG